MLWWLRLSEPGDLSPGASPAVQAGSWGRPRPAQHLSLPTLGERASDCEKHLEELEDRRERDIKEKASVLGDECVRVCVCAAYGVLRKDRLCRIAFEILWNR